MLTATVGIFFAVYHAALRTSFCPACKAVFILCCKPQNYYAPLLQEEFRLQAGKEVVIRASPLYSGKHGLYLNAAANSLLQIRGPVCKTDEGELTLLSTDTKVFDNLGEGISLATFNIDTVQFEQELSCRFTAESSADAFIRIVKLSGLSGISERDEPSSSLGSLSFSRAGVR
ncbi:hypothetical protein [Arenimonas composti]|uniref:hypothetical protein n=1 Tax=Arenimonas composti TaxID=370776 RepID=UPI0012B5454A|nr:hypothetical protein [Arenimonas composti]